MKTSYLLVLLVGILFLQSCNLINPDEDVPAYIIINEIEFTGEFTNSHKITEVWVFDGGTMLGAYDLPAEIPILREGSIELQFNAGIKTNGISSSRIIYPFYLSDKQIVNLVKGEKTTVVPSFELVEEVVYPSESIDQFDTPGTNYGETITSLANIETIEIVDQVFEGDGSGYVHLDSEDFYWQGKSLGAMELPYGEIVFLEFNYKCTIPFGVGIIANSSANSVEDINVIMNSTLDSNGVAQWNKIYVDIGSLVSSYPGSTAYNVLFEANLSTSDPEGEIWLDNIYVIHFE